MNIIEIFKLLGSALGFISFFLVVVTPLYNHNRDQWLKVRSIIDLSDLESLCDGASIGVVYQEPNLKLKLLLNHIRKDLDLMHFKGLNGKRIRRNLKKIEKAADRFYQEVQVPRWNYVEGDSDRIGKRLDKGLIYQEYETAAEANEVIDQAMRIATSEVETIIELYRKSQRSALKTPFEYLIKK